MMSLKDETLRHVQNEFDDRREYCWSAGSSLSLLFGMLGVHDSSLSTLTYGGSFHSVLELIGNSV